MHTTATIIADLARLGIRPDERLLVHSSMKAIGDVLGRADAVVDALLQHLRDGLLLLPTHTWKEQNNPGGIFDPRVERSCVGILPERFRLRPGVVRSWHPTHSIAGCGRGAEDFLAGEENTRTPCPRRGCWGRLFDIEARILFLGAPLRTNTFLHSVEEWHGIPNRLASEATRFRIRRPDGSLVECPQFRHFSTYGDVSQNYGKVEVELLRAGIACEGMIGDARSVLCAVRPMAELVGRHLARDPAFFEKP